MIRGDHASRGLVVQRILFLGLVLLLLSGCTNLMLSQARTNLNDIIAHLDPGDSFTLVTSNDEDFVSKFGSFWKPCAYGRTWLFYGTNLAPKHAIDELDQYLVENGWTHVRVDSETATTYYDDKLNAALYVESESSQHFAGRWPMYQGGALISAEKAQIIESHYPSALVIQAESYVPDRDLCYGNR